MSWKIEWGTILSAIEEMGSQGWNQSSDVAVNTTAINASETNILYLHATDCTYILNTCTLKFADPGANTITVKLYSLINDVLVTIKSFSVTTANYTTYFTLVDMFGVSSISSDNLKVTIQASAGGPYACTGQYQYGEATLTPTQILDPLTDFVPRGYYAETYLHTIDADLAVGNIKTGVNIFGFVGTYDTSASPIMSVDIKTGEEGWVNGAKVTGSGTKTLSDASTAVAAGYYAVTDLVTIDSDLATENIKSGITIFGIAGKTEVVDTTEAGSPVIAARMKTNDIAFVNGSKITGSGTQTLSNANDTVAAGYYAATTLHAIDADLTAANIASGITIFGIAGVYDVEVTNPISAGIIPTGKIGWVNGAKITGTGTKTLSDASTTVEAGYYAATDLVSVDSDLVVGNIKSGATIFGISGISTVVDVSDTTAAAGDVKVGTYFYTAAGVRTLGTHPA